ncbi:MAG: ABC transporter ATP-binding protein [Candidatus Binatia bacterium]
MRSFLRLRGLSKCYGSVTAVSGLNLDISEGEFFTLLGPSGCGKTTTLRLIGGLEKPDDGEISLGDRCLVSIPQRIFTQPEKREMGMVFQSYAIWPHMTVFENVAYPLKLRRLKAAAIREKVREALNLVDLGELGNRPAPMLSGGQQQRVALARALVFSPRVLLLDEPLSNLDARLRDEMRGELKALQRRLGLTVLFVTHDQIEALSLSDRLAIMNDSRMDQVGSPEEVYNHPSTPFVRDFLGRIFALEGRVVSVMETYVRVDLESISGSLQVNLANNPGKGSPLEPGLGVIAAIRPEQILLSKSVHNGKPNVFPATVEALQFMGDRKELTVLLGSEKRVLMLPSSQNVRPGEQVFLELESDHITLWPRQP